MEPTNIRFGGGASETNLHPLVAIVLLIAMTLIFLLPRKYVLIPSLFTVLLVPFGQVLVLAGVHFTVYRIVVLFGLARLLTSKPATGKSRLAGGFNAVDGAFALCALFGFVAFSFQWVETQAIIKAVGSLLDALGGYFVARFLIQNMEDVERAIKVFAVITVILAVCMTNEYFTRRNVFGLLGGVPLVPAVRDGKTRSQGTFEVYITAGAFGATLLPLFIWLWSDAKARIVGFVAMVGATVIALTSNSSTNLLAYAAAIVGLLFWPLRKRMRTVRWGLILLLVGLHLSMKAPVWALIQRIDLTGSSSGYQRFELVDQCIRHFRDWWLIGAKNYDTWGIDMWDLSNQYVACAVTGGLATLITFILVISRSFGRLGTARKLAEGDPKKEWFVWFLCAALLSHVVAYFGIGYFDQMQFAWYTFLAMVSAVTVVEARSPVTKAALDFVDSSVLPTVRA